MATTATRSARPRGYAWFAAMVALPAILGGYGGRASASPPTVRIGILLFGDSRQPQVDGFIDGMKSLGYEPGKSVRYFVRNAGNDRDKLMPLAQSLIARRVNLLVAAGGLEGDTLRAVAAKRGIPVVVLYINAIIERHLVQSRRHPGWGVTGVDNLNAQLSGKRIELLHDLLPHARRVLVLYTPRIAPSRIGMQRAELTARKFNMKIVARVVKTREDILRTMQSLKPGDVDAMLMVPNAPIENALKAIILPQVRRLKLPLMTYSRSFVKAGALASYGANFYDMGNQAARLAGKVLAGIRPENIPFETPKRFVYVINGGVEKELGIKLTDLTRSEVSEFISTGR